MDTAGLVSSVVLGEGGTGVGVRSPRAGDGTSVMGRMGMMVVWGRSLGGASAWLVWGLLPRGEGERTRRGLGLVVRHRCGGGGGGGWGTGV